MDVFNQDSARAALGVTWRLVGIDRTINPNWANGLTDGSAQEQQMKTSLRTGGPNVLNIYTVLLLSMKQVTGSAYITRSRVAVQHQVIMSMTHLSNKALPLDVLQDVTLAPNLVLTPSHSHNPPSLNDQSQLEKAKGDIYDVLNTTVQRISKLGHQSHNRSIYVGLAGITFLQYPLLNSAELLPKELSPTVLSSAGNQVLMDCLKSTFGRVIRPKPSRISFLENDVGLMTLLLLRVIGTERGNDHSPLLENVPFALQVIWAAIQSVTDSGDDTSGILLALWNCPFNVVEPYVDDLVKTLEWLVHTQDQTGNWPSKAPDNAYRCDNELVQWCHGASGILILLSKASRQRGYGIVLDERLREKVDTAMIQGAQVVYSTGLLTKGIGICHGVAGSVYALLAVSQALDNRHNILSNGSSVYLREALHLALLAAAYEELEKNGAMRVPDHPWSLYEGAAGMCCAWVDVLCGLSGHDTGGIPGFDDLD
ncbi:hypothetical protein H0H87_003575 [Tephrocybe sp. NHM501043]|nr:hypothetical protein H0H87_003575 [Tephrocybe sp. NHM501043]